MGITGSNSAMSHGGQVTQETFWTVLSTVPSERVKSLTTKENTMLWYAKFRSLP